MVFIKYFQYLGPTKLGWLPLAPTAVTEEGEESGEEGSPHQAGAEHLQVEAGEHQGDPISLSSKSQQREHRADEGLESKNNVKKT